MNSTVLITGATGGLGREFAEISAKDGNGLLLTARNAHKLEEMKQALEKKYGVYAFASENKIAVDVLINNAGFGDFGEFTSCDYEKQREMVNLNVLALMRLTYMFAPAMVNNGSGKILNVPSSRVR